MKNWRHEAQMAVDAAEIAHDMEQDADELGEDSFESVARELLFGAPVDERQTRINAAVLRVSMAFDRGGFLASFKACETIDDDIRADCLAPIKRAILGR